MKGFLRSIQLKPCCKWNTLSWNNPNFKTTPCWPLCKMMFIGKRLTVVFSWQKLKRLLCQAQTGCCYYQMTASSCRGRSTVMQRAAKVVWTYAKHTLQASNSLIYSMEKILPEVLRSPPFSWEASFSSFPKTVSLCKDVLLACHQSKFPTRPQVTALSL